MELDPDDKGLLIWAQGHERYFAGEAIILSSDSWKEAQEKTRKYVEGRKKREGNYSYFEPDGSTMWYEYQFIFLCQYVEFRLAEYIFTLYKKHKVKPELLIELRANKKINPERSKSEIRLISPASLIFDLGYTLGDLISVVRDKTIDFDVKKDLLTELSTFNEKRVSFVHHTFTSEKKATHRTMDEIMKEGKKIGFKIIGILNATYAI